MKAKKKAVLMIIKVESLYNIFDVYVFKFYINLCLREREREIFTFISSFSKYIFCHIIKS